MVERSNCTRFSRATCLCKVEQVQIPQRRNFFSFEMMKRSTAFVTFHGFLPHRWYLYGLLPTLPQSSLQTLCINCLLGVPPCKFLT